MDYEKIVSDAAKYLDESHVGWWREVDRKRLDINDPCDCIYGQLYGDFCAGEDIHHSAANAPLVRNMSIYGAFLGSVGADPRTSLWLAEINSRLEADKNNAAVAFIARTNEIINQPLREEALPCPRT